MANKDIRQQAKNKGVYLWEVADALKVSEPTMTRKMRKELPESEKAEIFGIIESIAESKAAIKGGEANG
ncbi:MAG: hypothetical protein J1E96_04510 [Ruminococcus sp.]|nr:hypothetical protein [Ruminococcus sp.]